MPLDVNGFDDLMTDIAGMASKMDADGAGAPVAKRILEAAAVPIHEQMQANASHDPQILSANLHAALQIGRVKRSSKRGRHITIGVHRNQQAYYQRYVRNHPEYQLVDIFADEGITGLNTRKRDQFKRMIEECEAGHVDMIITKSISRMFRNHRTGTLGSDTTGTRPPRSIPGKVWLAQFGPIYSRPAFFQPRLLRPM